MNQDPLYIDLFTTVLAHTQAQAFDKSVELAEEAGKQAAHLSNAQINGLAELGKALANVDQIKEEVTKRETKRWKKKDQNGKVKDGPGPQIEKGIAALRKDAVAAVDSAEAELGQALGNPEAGKRPAGRNWVNDLHLALTRNYLVAVATVARIESSAATANASKKENG